MTPADVHQLSNWEYAALEEFAVSKIREAQRQERAARKRR